MGSTNVRVKLTSIQPMSGVNHAKFLITVQSIVFLEHNLNQVDCGYVGCGYKEEWKDKIY